MLELARDKIEPAVAIGALEMPPHQRELLRRRVLKRKDRLLLVADGENRARQIARALAGGEFGHQPPHDLPLLVAGILRLVDQNMVDAEIELVVHPGGIDVAQERKRLVDQVVIVEQAAAFLLGRVAPQHRVDDGEERAAAVAADHGVAPLENLTDAALLGVEKLDQPRILDRPGDDGFARIAFVGAEDLQIKLDAIGAGQSDQRGEALRLLGIGLVAARERRRNRRPFRFRDQ